MQDPDSNSKELKAELPRTRTTGQPAGILSRAVAAAAAVAMGQFLLRRLRRRPHRLPKWTPIVPSSGRQNWSAAARNCRRCFS